MCHVLPPELGKAQWHSGERKQILVKMISATYFSKIGQVIEHL